MTIKSEIFKAAHRQAKRMECVGGPSYAKRFAEALKFMIAASKSEAVKSVGRGYDDSLCHTLTANQHGGLWA